MSKSKKTTKKTSAPKVTRSAIAESLEDMKARETAKIETKRKRLLANVAGRIAASLILAPSDAAKIVPEGGLPDFIADASIEFAEAILKRVGL